MDWWIGGCGPETMWPEYVEGGVDDGISILRDRQYLVGLYALTIILWRHDGLQC